MWYRETVPDAAYQSFLGKYAGLRASLPHTASHLLVIGRVADPDSIGSGQWIRIQEGKNDPQK
jgi:hypothetical protein